MMRKRTIYQQLVKKTNVHNLVDAQRRFGISADVNAGLLQSIEEQFRGQRDSIHLQVVVDGDDRVVVQREVLDDASDERRLSNAFDAGDEQVHATPKRDEGGRIRSARNAVWVVRELHKAACK